jgi:hypothetical protein
VCTSKYCYGVRCTYDENQTEQGDCNCQVCEKLRVNVGMIECYQKKVDCRISVNGILTQFMANLGDEDKGQSPMDDKIYGWLGD